MIGDGELQEVAGDAFVTENGARVFDGGADIEIFALWVVGRDEVEAARIPVVLARRIHEAAGTGRFESLWKLADVERAEIGRKRDEVVFTQEANHLGLSSLV